MPEHPDRQVLFGNEAFTIGVLQAVSLAAMAGTISQFDALSDLAGRALVLVFFTLMVLTLLSSVSAAYFRHQYKMWDVKREPTRADHDLKRMRRSMTWAVVIRRRAAAKDMAVAAVAAKDMAVATVAAKDQATAPRRRLTAVAARAIVVRPRDTAARATARRSGTTLSAA